MSRMLLGSVPSGSLGRRTWCYKAQSRGLCEGQLDLDPAWRRKPSVRPVRNDALLRDDKLPLFPGFLDPDDDLGARHIVRASRIGLRWKLEDACERTILEGWPRPLRPDLGLSRMRCRIDWQHEPIAPWKVTTIQRQGITGGLVHTGRHAGDIYQPVVAGKHRSTMAPALSQCETPQAKRGVCGRLRKPHARPVAVSFPSGRGKRECAD